MYSLSGVVNVVIIYSGMFLKCDVLCLLGVFFGIGGIFLKLIVLKY